MPRRTVLLVPVPDAEHAVAEIRLRHDPAAALGVPAHVTILFPFAPFDQLDLDALAALFARHPAFDFELASVERFEPPVTYLAPVPAAPFLALTDDVCALWPAYPPFEGVFPTVVPHLTIAHGDVAFGGPLPIACRARDVALFEEDEAGRWHERARWALTE
jgi:2'-5' RNA ligase superfamily